MFVTKECTDCDSGRKHRRRDTSRRRNGPAKKKESLEEIYKELNRDYVKIKTTDRKHNNTILTSVLKEILKLMKKHDGLFKNMNPKLGYLGSYFDGLRVGQPTEYDLNVIFKLHVNYNKIFLDATEAAYDCTNIFMPSEFRRLSKIPATVKIGFHETSMWCDQRYRLSVKKFRSWMQKVVDKAMATLPVVGNKRLICVNNKPYLLFSKMSGPACTITIKEVNSNDHSSSIDVDLVPTFSFKLPKKPRNSKVNFDYLDNQENKEYFVVPKPSEDDYSWRLAFPYQEKYIISNQNNLKSVVKLLKLLRDVQDFKLLASYYIKTVFLWEVIQQNTENRKFWKDNSMSYLLLHMLKKLRDCLATGEIKNFWCPEANLLKNKIKKETCRNWSNRLTFIINTIEQKGKENPNIVAIFFYKKEVLLIIVKTEK